MKIIKLSDFKRVPTNKDTTELKMQEIGRNFAFFTHEQANLMALLLGRVSQLETTINKGEDPSKCINKLKLTLNTSTNLLTLMKQINTTKVEHKLLDLHKILDNFLVVYGKELFNNRVTLINELDCEIPEIYGEESLLFMILQTMAANTIRAFNENNKDCRIITISTKISSNSVELLFKDTAGGMPRDKAESILGGDKSTVSGTGQGIELIKAWSDHLGIETALMNVEGVGCNWKMTFLTNKTKENAA